MKKEITSVYALVKDEHFNTELNKNNIKSRLFSRLSFYRNAAPKWQEFGSGTQTSDN